MIKTATALIVNLSLFITFQSSGQVKDSVRVSDTTFKQPKLKSFIPGAIAITYGFAAINSTWLRKLDDHIYENVNRNHPGYRTKIDDYLRYAPALSVYALDLIGVKGRNNLKDKTALLLMSTVVMGGTMQILKSASNRVRPNRTNDFSFPSGHTALAFSGAEFLNQEYGDESVWYSIGGYTAATATGIFRMYKNAHWFSDVVAGAGVGIISTKFVYLVYPSIKRMFSSKGHSNFTALPVYQNQTFGLAISGKF